MDFKDSQTYKNLQNSFETQLMFSSRLELSASQAIQDGYINIADNFAIASNNDLALAKVWQRQINQGNTPDTMQNLNSASKMANYLGNNLYRSYSQTAIDEGYNDIASLFNGIANIELNHESTFLSFYNEIKSGEIFCKQDEILWICMNCGHILSGICAPIICPICKFPQGYYRPYDRDGNL